MIDDSLSPEKVSKRFFLLSFSFEITKTSYLSMEGCRLCTLILIGDLFITCLAVIGRQPVTLMCTSTRKKMNDWILLELNEKYRIYHLTHTRTQTHTHTPHCTQAFTETTQRFNEHTKTEWLSVVLGVCRVGCH